MRRRIWIAAGGGAVLALLIGAGVAGLRFNSTRSIAQGLYRVTEEPLRAGAYVLACPPPVQPFLEARARLYIGPGICPGRMGYLMKRVVAVCGDRVELTEAAVVVNGRAVPGSARLPADTVGRPLPQPTSASTVLGDEVLLMGDVSPRSFDGRYFGPVDRTHILAVIRPVFTWN
ncbi:conjugative transfer signal peptidase TraF [Azohydromonas caseinilytica]|uniref:Conjugative transfer signal peptidase TraF n=1 Tax=Azohydromonas caseinilytica TaxID=2728836 RepID=A0A848FCE3_9BURK|nr:conjugative transfer signal peptidase TraF [Azohydromonas caseinilytica]NML16992.1 conjugative transfer signal peptidase TraF [Azohydromonas caseinilytica]